MSMIKNILNKMCQIFISHFMNKKFSKEKIELTLVKMLKKVKLNKKIIQKKQIKNKKMAKLIKI